MDVEIDVQFDNVGLKYPEGPEVLRDVSFTLTKGSFHFLIGPSGAGKSSILKLLFLALRPTRGIITLLGQDMSTLPHRELPFIRRRIGVVFQDFYLIDHLSAFDNVALPLRIQNYSEENTRRYVTEVLSWIGLKDRMYVQPALLSGGEKQRVAIARAVSTRPQLLLADEPTGSVDQKMGQRLLSIFEQLNRNGTTVVIATHDEHLVERLQKPVLSVASGQVTRQMASGRSRLRGG